MLCCAVLAGVTHDTAHVKVVLQNGSDVLLPSLAGV